MHAGKGSLLSTHRLHIYAGYMDGTCFGLECGDLANWVAGVATTLAVIVALLQLGLETMRRRRDTEMEQAQSVSAWFDFHSHRIYVRNDSNSVIYSVFVDIVLTTEPMADKGTTPGAFRGTVPFIAPKSTVAVVIERGSGGMSKTQHARVAFQDQRGQSWLRDNAGRLKKLKAPVYRHFGVSAPYTYSLYEYLDP